MEKEKIEGEKPIFDVGTVANLVAVSDGYHTFDELYEHRFALFIALCKRVKGAWRAKYNSDGTLYNGWFVMGIGTKEGKQVTYHLPKRLWKQTAFCKTYINAPNFDGHTSHDVIKRLYDL